MKLVESVFRRLKDRIFGDYGKERMRMCGKGLG